MQMEQDTEIMQTFHQIQAKGCDHVTVLPQEAVELGTIRQLRKGGLQMLLGIAVKRAFAGKLDPLAKYCQGDHFAALQRGPWARNVLLMNMPRLAKIINHDVQCSQEGIQIDLKLAPFLTKWFDKLTVRPGYRSFQVLSISHQTFNCTPTSATKKMTFPKLLSFK